MSFDFAFKPKNWKKNFSFLEEINQNNIFKIIIFLFFITNYIFYTFISSVALIKKKKSFAEYFLIINLFLYSYLIIVSFYGSTWEQERMRYSGYSFIFISISILIKEILSKINNQKLQKW